MAPDPRSLDVDEVRIIHVDDADVAGVNEALAQGWRLLACGVAEQREVSPTGGRSAARCSFILGRNREEQVLAQAAAVVEAVEGEVEPVVTIPAAEALLGEEGP